MSLYAETPEIQWIPVNGEYPDSLPPRPEVTECYENGIVSNMSHYDRTLNQKEIKTIYEEG